MARWARDPPSAPHPIPCVCTSRSEGEIIGPLRRIVRIIEVATPSIVALLVVLLPIILLTALMHAQLYGLFDHGFADMSIAITRVVRTLFAPPPPEISEDESAEASIAVRPHHRAPDPRPPTPDPPPPTPPFQGLALRASHISTSCIA